MRREGCLRSLGRTFVVLKLQLAQQQMKLIVVGQRKVLVISVIRYSGRIFEILIVHIVVRRYIRIVRNLHVPSIYNLHMCTFFLFDISS